MTFNSLTANSPSCPRNVFPRIVYSRRIGVSAKSPVIQPGPGQSSGRKRQHFLSVIGEKKMQYFCLILSAATAETCRNSVEKF